MTFGSDTYLLNGTYSRDEVSCMKHVDIMFTSHMHEF